MDNHLPLPRAHCGHLPGEGLEGGEGVEGSPGNGGTNGWDREPPWETPHNPMGGRRGLELGMIPIGMPPREKSPKKDSPEGGKEDRDHQPPQMRQWDPVQRVTNFQFIWSIAEPV